jgi:hypothetical protein
MDAGPWIDEYPSLARVIDSIDMYLNLMHVVPGGQIPRQYIHTLRSSLLGGGGVGSWLLRRAHLFFPPERCKEQREGILNAQIEVG